MTSELKAWLVELIEGNHEQIKADLQAIEPEERVRLLFSVLPYIIPKQQSIKETTQIDIPIKVIDFGDEDDDG